jgi:hypothetical protein
MSCVLNVLGQKVIIQYVCTRLFLFWLLGLWWRKGFELLRFPRFCPVADLFPWRESLEISDKKLSLNPDNMLCGVPKGLSQLEGLVDNTLLLFVISDLCITLW